MNHNIRAIILLLFTSLNSCNELSNSSSELINHIPDQAELLIQVQGNNQQKKETHNLLKRFFSFDEFENVQDQLALLNEFNSGNKGLLSFVQLEKDKLDFLLIKKQKNESISQSVSATTSVYDNEMLYNYQKNDRSLYGWSKDGIQFLSSSQLLIENSIRNFNRRTTSDNLINLYNKSSRNNIFIKANSSSWLSKKLQIGAKQPKNIASWIALETEESSAKTKAHGISTLNDSIEHFLYLFKGQKPTDLKSSNYAPYTTEALWSFGVSDFEQFQRHKNLYLGKKHISDTLYISIKEFAQLSLNDKKIHLFRGVYVDQIFEKFSTNSIVYQGISVADFNSSSIQNHFYPVLELKEDRFSCLIDDVLFTSSSQNALKTLISSYNTKATFNRSSIYRTMNKEFASRSNINFIGKLSKAITQLKDENNEVFGLQWVADKNYFHTHMSLKKLDLLPNAQQVAPLFSLKLEAPIQLGPFVVTNHQTNEKELIVQDQNNQLYLIDNSGNILWKKQMDSAINEKIHQVDLYKNRRLQFAFTTDSQFLVLDRNGKEIKKLTRNFKDGNLSTLSVFDYDNSRQYRLVFSQGNDIFMLNNKAKNVSGFKFSKAEASLVEPPKHFRMGTTDYLVFKLSNGALKILNRRGNTKIKTPTHYDFSINEIYTFQGHFVFTDRGGKLHFIDQNGTDNIENTFDPNHFIDIKEEGIASLSENQLKFRDKTYTLPFGSYASVKLLQFENRYFITTTDKDTSRVYLFDTELNLLEQFPVFGFSTATMDDLDNNGTLELISLDGPDGIIVYSGL